MKNYALLAGSLLAGTTGTVAKKYYTDKSADSIASKCIYTAASCLVAAICIAFVGNMMKPSFFTVLIAILFGTTTAIQGITMMVAMQLGPVSYTMMFASFSTVITALSGALFFDEELTSMKVAGILLMLASFAFAGESGTEKKKGNFAWLMLCVVVFLSTGGIGLMQKVHQISPYKAELDVFLVLAFIVTAIVSFLVAVFTKKANSEGKFFFGTNKKALAFILTVTLGGGVCVAINNKLNLFLSGVMETSVFFPIANGGTVVLSTIAAFFLFKERLSKKRLVGLFIGVLSIILLCI